MSALLRRGGVTEEMRMAHNRHHWLTVAVVSLLLLTYAWLFTHISYDLSWPTPQQLLASIHLDLAHVFDGDQNVNSFVQMERTTLFYPFEDQRLLYLIILFAAFLSAYFLPLHEKRAAIVFWSVLAIGALYGVRACMLVLALHTLLYLIFHPKKSLLWAMLPGLLLWVSMSADHQWTVRLLSWWAWMPLVSALVYHILLLPLLECPRIAPVLRTVAAQSAIITILIGVCYNGMSDGEEWKFVAGLLLFFFQWERIIMYHIDYKDGAVPADLNYFHYLSVFFSPGAVPNFTDRVAIAQGYAYTDKTFYCRDKNLIILDGVKLLLIAMLYLIFGNWLRYASVDAFEALGIPVFGGNTHNLLYHYMQGEFIATSSVLAATMLNLFKWFIFFAAVGHFKVGVWRLMGYDIAPSFDKPWLATNLVSFWGRFTFHYREFLVRAFYYPVFFRYFRKHRKTRIVMATLASAGLGNMVWGHMVEIAYYRGIEFESLVFVAGHWPYYLLLGGGIALTELYLLKHKRKRKPWSRDRWLITDVLAAYATLQFFALIHVFNRSAGGATTWDQTKLFLIGLGIHI